MNSGFDVMRAMLDGMVTQMKVKDDWIILQQKDIIELRTAIGLMTYLIHDSDSQYAIDILTKINLILERTNHYAEHS